MSRFDEIVRIDSDAVVTQYGYSQMRVKPLVSFPRNIPCNYQGILARAAGGHSNNHTVYKVENADGGVVYIGFKDEYMHIGTAIEPRGF